MLGPFKLKRPIAADRALDPADTLKTKIALARLGYYAPPRHGFTEFPDVALIAAIKRFQKDNSLPADGVIRPGGATERELRGRLPEHTPLPHPLPDDGIWPDRRWPGREWPEREWPDRGLPLDRLPAGEAVPYSTGQGSTTTEDGKKSGKYIWHTVGDNRVRSSHAARDGQEFDWEDPPEGGHPGEAPGCRCTAEDVEEEDGCEPILEELEAAYKRHDDLHAPIEKLKSDIDVTEKIIGELQAQEREIIAKIAMAMAPDGLDRVGPFGRIAGAAKSSAEIQRLQRMLEGIEQQIQIESRNLAQQRKRLDQLESEQEKHASTAAEYSRRYQDCLGKK